MKLRIAENLTLPADAVTQTFAILAKRGAGKTYTASVLAEELLKAKQQVVIIDPTGAWWGLRASADGKSQGFSILVAGGDHGDIPLDEHAGEMMATALVDRFSVVLDLSTFRKGQSIRFMTPFLETLYRLNRSACHVIIDEADTFAPQRLLGEEARMCGAMEDLVKKGRIRGLGCTLITQRPAVLNKNVLTQCESLFALRMTHPKDIAAIKEWVGVHSSPDEADTVIDSLPSLPIGQAWFWSPGWMKTLELIDVRRRETFDSSATPKAGEQRRSPKQLAQVDIEALGKMISQAAEEAKQNDPRELRRKVADLERELAKRPAIGPAETKIERVEVPVLPDQIADRLEKCATDLTAVLSEVLSGLANFRTRPREVCHRPAVHRTAAVVNKSSATGYKPAPAMHKTAPRGDNSPAGADGNEDGRAVPTGGLKRMLIALAQRPHGLSKKQLGVRAGLSSKSGSFRTYLGKARTNRWAVGGSDRIQVTTQGLEALGEYEPLPTGQALLEYWLRELGGGAGRMLQALAEVYPRTLTKSDLAERAEISITSGSARTYLGKLRALELVEGRKELLASRELFE